MASIELTLKPRKGWQAIDFQETWLHRELLAFLVWRDIKIRYRQTVLGGLWAILQPLVAMIIFTVFFNRMAGIGSNGAPYPLFAYAGLIPWLFFSNAVSLSSNSLLANQQMISKIYFPRIFIPLAAILALALDMLLSLLLMGGLMVYYRWPLPLAAAALPLFALAGILAASGLGFIFSALNVSYRDVKYAVPFLVQMGFFVTPVIYPVRYLPERFQVFLGINPMAGVVEGFRYCLLGTPVNWQLVTLSLLITVALFIFGLFLFRRMERRFADVI